MQKIASCSCLWQGFYNEILNGLAKSGLLVSCLEDKTVKLKKSFLRFQTWRLVFAVRRCRGCGGREQWATEDREALFWTCLLSIGDQYMRAPQVWQDWILFILPIFINAMAEMFSCYSDCNFFHYQWVEASLYVYLHMCFFCLWIPNSIRSMCGGD